MTITQAIGTNEPIPATADVANIVPNPVPVIDKDIPIEQDKAEKEENKSAPDLDERPKPVIIDVSKYIKTQDAKDGANKSEAGEEGEKKDHVLQALDHFTKEKEDLDKKIIEPAKGLINDEVKKLDEKKGVIDEMKQELYDKKEKLDEFREEKVVKPMQDAGKQYIERLKENASPENIMSRLGYNLNSQKVDNPESVKELMEAKKSTSAIDSHSLLKKAEVGMEDKVKDLGDKLGIMRKQTADPGEQQV